MDQKKKRLMMTVLCGCASTTVFTGCGATTDTINDTTSQQDTLTDNAMEIVKNDALAVDPKKCIGCGKCTRVASANFAMDPETRKAKVISQEVVAQATISQAVSVCPTHAITQ